MCFTINLFCSAVNLVMNLPNYGSRFSAGFALFDFKIYDFGFSSILSIENGFSKILIFSKICAYFNFDAVILACFLKLMHELFLNLSAFCINCSFVWEIILETNYISYILIARSFIWVIVWNYYLIVNSLLWFYFIRISSCSYFSMLSTILLANDPGSWRWSLNNSFTTCFYYSSKLMSWNMSDKNYE